MRLTTKLTSLAALVVLMTVIPSSSVSAGEPDICTAMSPKAAPLFQSGTARVTAQPEDIWWAFNGAGCQYFNATGVTVRYQRSISGSWSLYSTWSFGPNDYSRSKFITQEANGRTYRFQWTGNNGTASTTGGSQGKIHFEN
jgi:hypothetical protein